MTVRRVHRVVGFVLVGGLVFAACGGESADRERNIDATPTSSVTAPGPQYRELSFTETFTGTTMRAEGTTAEWGTESGKLTMAAAPAVREFKFTEQKLTYNPSASLSSVAAADYDGASEYTSWYGPNSVAFFRSAVSTAGGQEKTVMAVGDPSRALVIKQDDAMLADLNGDGAEELVRLEETSTPNKGMLMIQNLNRRLAQVETFDDPTAAERIVVGDFTRDGLLDIVTVGKRVTLHAQLRASGDTLMFATALSVDLLGVSELQSPIENVAVGDVDNDGFSDLVLSGPGNMAGKNGLIYLLSSATEQDSFTVAGVDLPTDVGSIGQVQVVNLDGLPGNELLLNTSARGLMYLPSTDIRRNGAGIQIDYPATYAWYGAAGDVTGDGVTDLAFVDKVGRVYLRIGTRGPGWWRGGGTVVVSPEIVSLNPRSVRVRDVNRDGQNDISVIERFTVRNFIVGSAQPAEAARISDETFINENFAASTTVEFGDVNRDGRSDVVICGTLLIGQCHISLNSGSPISPFEQTAPVVVSVAGTVISDAAIGDLSGDGYPELVVVGDKSIRIFNNTRDPVTPYLDVIPTGDSVSRVIQLSTAPAVSVVIDDVMGDAANDLVVARTLRTEVWLGLGSSVNSKTSTVTGVVTNVSYAVPPSTGVLFVNAQTAKLNSDSRADLVMVQGGSLLTATTSDLGATKQSTTTPISGNRSGRRLEPLVSDFDGDGRVDFVVVRDGVSSSVPPRVWVNRGKDGTSGSYFVDPAVDVTTMPVGTQAILGSRVINLNGDTKPDLAIPVSTQTGFAVYGLVNTSQSGTVSFAAPSVIATLPGTGDDVMSLHAGVFNSDAIPDVLRIGMGSYTFLLSTPTSREIGYVANDLAANLGGRQIDRLETANINGDGRPDLVAAVSRLTKTGLTAAAVLGDGSPSGFASTAEAIGENPYEITAMATGSLGRDALDDVVVAPWIGAQSFQNRSSVPDGQQRFPEILATTYLPRIAINDAAIGRVDGDSHGDLAVAINGSPVTSLSAVADQESLVSGRTGSQISIADVNKDGYGEYLVLETGALKVRRFLVIPSNPSSGVLQISDLTISTVGTETRDYSGLLVDDVNGDGLLDAIVATGRQTTAFVNGPLTTTRTVDAAARISVDDYSRMKLMDVNGDGLKDLVANRPTDTAPAVYLNNGSAAMPFKDRLTPAPVFAKDAAAGFVPLDMNSDGLDDIVVANEAKSPSVVSKMRSFTARVIPGYGNANGVAVSKPLSSDAFIEKVTLTPTATVPEGTAVTYEMTNNGTDWYEVTPSSEFVFPSNGKVLSWRAKLTSTDGAATPVITKIAVAARAYVMPVGASSAISLAGNGLLRFGWTPGVVSSGGVVKLYKVVDQPSGEILCSTIGTSCVASGLTNMKQYRPILWAENPAGVVTTSITGDFTPSPYPETLPKPTVKAVNGGIEVSWTPQFNPETHLPVLDYTARVADGKGTSKRCTTTELKCTVTGLTAGQQYWADVWARNAAGQGIASPYSDPVSPIGVPTIDATVTSGVTLVQLIDGSIGVRIKANLFASGGSPITRVKLWIDGQAVCASDKSIDKQPCSDSVTATSFAVTQPSLTSSTGFTPGTEYSISVSAVNEAGESVQSTPVKLTYLVPAPIDPTVRSTPGDGKVTFDWEIPPHMGPDYRVSVFDPLVIVDSTAMSCSATTPLTSCEITGLVNGRSYILVANAGNKIWNSSFVRLSVTPYAVPGTPTSVEVHTVEGVVDVSWAPPTNEDVAGLLDYDVVIQPGNRRCIEAERANSCSVAGFKRGDAVTVSVAAIGPSGRGPAVERAVTVSDKPGIVGNIERKPDVSSVGLSWTPPVDNGGSPIVSYDVLVDGVRVGTVTDTKFTIEGLTAGTRYTATIIARNEFGPVGEGASFVIVPMGRPSAPRITGAQQTGSSVVFSVEAPTNTGGATLLSYDCKVTRGKSAPEVVELCGVPGGDIVIDRGELKRGEDLTLQVSVWNELFKSTLSEVYTYKIADVPDTIGSVSMTEIDDDTKVFEITPPDDGGSPITDYRAEVTEIGASQPLMVVTTDRDNPRLTVDFPLGKMVTVSLYAVNAIGRSAPNMPFSYIMALADPGAPEISGVTAGDGEVVVGWKAPDFDGGSPIAGYSIEAVAEGSNDLPITVEVAEYERAAVVRGLTNGVNYRIVVTAYSQGGLGSAESDVVVPFGQPDPPVVVLDGVGDGFVDVRLDEPSNTGGLPVVAYEIETIPEGGTCTLVDRRCRMTGLTNGVGYVVSASLKTAKATSQPSVSASFTPLAVTVPATDVKDSVPSNSPARVTVPNLSISLDESGTAKPGSGGSTTTTVATAVVAPSTSAPRLLVGQKVALRALLVAFKVKLPKGSVALLEVTTAASKPCAVTKRFVTGRSAGQCRFTILVQPKKGKAKRVNVNVEVVAAKS